MTPITDIPSLVQAINAFLLSHGSNLPTSVSSAALSGNPQKELLAAIGSMSPVVTICDTAEVLYAYRNEIKDADSLAAARTLCGQAAIYAAMSGWHNLGARGVAICHAMQRELGEAAPAGTAWPDPSTDPAPDGRFLAQPAPAPTPPGSVPTAPTGTTPPAS